MDSSPPSNCRPWPCTNPAELESISVAFKKKKPHHRDAEKGRRAQRDETEWPADGKGLCVLRAGPQGPPCLCTTNLQLRPFLRRSSRKTSHNLPRFNKYTSARLGLQPRGIHQEDSKPPLRGYTKSHQGVSTHPGSSFPVAAAGTVLKDLSGGRHRKSAIGAGAKPRMTLATDPRIILRVASWWREAPFVSFVVKIELFLRLRAALK